MQLPFEIRITSQLWESWKIIVIDNSNRETSIILKPEYIDEKERAGHILRMKRMVMDVRQDIGKLTIDSLPPSS